jgi:hypothetical protein
LRPLQNGTLCPISATGSNFNPRNIPYIPVVEIFAFLELEHKLPFFKGLRFFREIGSEKKGRLCCPTICSRFQYVYDRIDRCFGFAEKN